MFSSIIISFPDESSARSLTRILLERRLVACSNIYPIESAYWWKGEIEETKEWMAEFKTQSRLFTEIEKTVKKLHPYENPCIIAHSIASGSKDYLEWIKESTD